jgi:hypothetical protein
MHRHGILNYSGLYKVIVRQDLLLTTRYQKYENRISLGLQSTHGVPASIYQGWLT